MPTISASCHHPLDAFRWIYNHPSASPGPATTHHPRTGLHRTTQSHPTRPHTADDHFRIRRDTVDNCGNSPRATPATYTTSASASNTPAQKCSSSPTAATVTVLAPHPHDRSLPATSSTPTKLLVAQPTENALADGQDDP